MSGFDQKYAFSKGSPPRKMIDFDSKRSETTLLQSRKSVKIVFWWGFATFNAIEKINAKTVRFLLKRFFKVFCKSF